MTNLPGEFDYTHFYVIVSPPEPPLLAMARITKVVPRPTPCAQRLESVADADVGLQRVFPQQRSTNRYSRKGWPLSTF